jgi:hypothetical protein
MRPIFIAASLVALLGVLGAGFWPSDPAIAAAPYCPNPAHARPEKAPPDLTSALATAFNIDEAGAREGAFVRCVGSKVMGCAVGANLVCDKADRRRALPGATAWCRDNPDSKGIPMAATGHATIYEWSCRGRRAVAGRTVLTVDPDGYIAENWREIP